MGELFLHTQVDLHEYASGTQAKGVDFTTPDRAGYIPLQKDVLILGKFCQICMLDARR